MRGSALFLGLLLAACAGREPPAPPPRSEMRPAPRLETRPPPPPAYLEGDDRVFLAARAGWARG